MSDPGPSGSTASWRSPDATPRPAPMTERPPVSLGGVVAAVAGVLLVIGFVELLGELPDSHNRAWGIVASIAFEVVGLLLLTIGRHRASVTTGVAATALGALPLVVYAFVDP